MKCTSTISGLETEMRQHLSTLWTGNSLPGREVEYRYRNSSGANCLLRFYVSTNLTFKSITRTNLLDIEIETSGRNDPETRLPTLISDIRLIITFPYLL